MKCPKCHFDNPSDSKFCKEEGSYYIIMEYVPGEDLKSSIVRMDGKCRLR